MYVDFVRDGVAWNRRQRPPGERVGDPSALRLCERWTSSAKSVFRFDVQGSVAKSTHAGILWLRFLCEQAGDPLFFWPFDGWQPPQGKSVIAEIYPSIFRNRYPKGTRTPMNRMPMRWRAGSRKRAARACSIVIGIRR
jgi:hypothetical protein